MPFRIIRGDINTASGDARVEAVLDCSGAMEAEIHPVKKGRFHRKYDTLYTVAVNEYSFSRANQENCQYVIRTPVPFDERSLSHPDVVRHCYRSALQIAHDFGLKSVAVPLIGSEDKGCSKELALQIASEEIINYLDENEDTDILLVVRDRQNFWPNPSVCAGLSEFLQSVEEQEQKKQKQEWNALQMCSTAPFPTVAELDIEDEVGKRPQAPESISLTIPTFVSESDGSDNFYPQKPIQKPTSVPKAVKPGLVFPFTMFNHGRETDLDESFSQMMLRKMDEKGFKKDSDFYKKANISKQTFSKMKSPDYHPKKTTAVAVVIALELSLDDANELLRKAGYCLSRSMRFDVIIEYFIEAHHYDVFEINEQLFKYDQALLGG